MDNKRDTIDIIIKGSQVKKCLGELPTPETIRRYYEEFILFIGADIYNNYILVNEIEIGKYYRSTFEELIRRTNGMKEIIEEKKELTFEELCEYYNNLLHEYNYIYNNSQCLEAESINRRVGMYSIILDNIEEIYKFKK